jgi:hypothetical protein
MTTNNQDEPEEGAYPRVEALLQFVTDTIEHGEKNNVYNMSLYKIKEELEKIKTLLSIS